MCTYICVNFYDIMQFYSQTQCLNTGKAYCIFTKRLKLLLRMNAVRFAEKKRAPLRKPFNICSGIELLT